MHHSPPQVPHIVLLPRSDDVRPSPVSCNCATVPPDDTPLALHHPPDSSRDMPSITPTSQGVPPPPLWISQLMPSCFPPWPPWCRPPPPKEDPHAPAGCFEPHSNDSIPPDTPSLYHMFSHRPWLTPTTTSSSGILWSWTSFCHCVPLYDVLCALYPIYELHWLLCYIIHLILLCKFRGNKGKAENYFRFGDIFIRK